MPGGLARILARKTSNSVNHGSNFIRSNPDVFPGPENPVTRELPAKSQIGQGLSFFDPTLQFGYTWSGQFHYAVVFLTRRETGRVQLLTVYIYS